MKILVSSTGRFVMTPDGTLWAPPSLEYDLWRNYLEVFDHVKLLARVKAQDCPPLGWKEASGKGVEAVSLPYFVGPAEFMRVFPALKKCISRALTDAEAIVLRLPCWIGGLACRSLRAGHPYGVEVLGDPSDVFAPGAVKHPGRPFFRWWFPRQLRYECAHASSAAYVTGQALQRRYPPSPHCFSTHFSSIGLGENDLLTQPRRVCRSRSEFNLVTVGNLDHPYKGTDVLIKALHKCVAAGLNIRAVVVGDGRYRTNFQNMTAKLGLQERVRFLGQLPSGEPVRAQLDSADLFVLPSRAEGLPRAMVEAMARGLPCIGSTAGGIPELLSPEDMVPPGDAAALAAAIRAVISDPDRMETMSARNLAAAQSYHGSILRDRRQLFYQNLKTSTGIWLDQTR